MKFLTRDQLLELLAVNYDSSSQLFEDDIHMLFGSFGGDTFVENGAFVTTKESPVLSAFSGINITRLNQNNDKT